MFNFEVSDVLSRTKKTDSQFGLSLSQRKKNIKNAFSIFADEKVAGLNVFLVDDIATTGSTLLEATRVLKRGGAGKVIGLTLARD